MNVSPLTKYNKSEIRYLLMDGRKMKNETFNLMVEGGSNKE